jgi:hypothetical protein
MTDIEGRLRSAMHEAIDNEEAAPEELIVAVRKRHRRHRAVMAGTAVVAALAVLVPTAIVLHGKIARSGGVSPNGAAAGGTKLSSVLSGLSMPAGKNFEVLVTTGYGAGWYSVATHATKTIKGLPAVAGGYQFGRVNGGWVASPNNYSSPCASNVCAGPPTTYYFISEGSLTATRIGRGYGQGPGVGAGTRAGTVWLVTYPASTSRWYSSARAQLVSTTGRPLGSRYRLPDGYLMNGGVGPYLLLGSGYNNYVQSELWDPRTGRVLRTFENVVAHSSRLIIWSRGCPRCQLQITDASSGKTQATQIPGSQPDNLNSTLSDDGRLLAVQLPSGELAVLNTVTMSLTNLAGTALTKANFEYFGWQNGGHRLLVFAGPNIGPGADQLAYWQPGDRHLYVETIRNPNDMEQLQTGSQ